MHLRFAKVGHSRGRIVAFVLVLLVAACGSAEERAKSHYERGLELLEEKNLVKAELEFKNALQLQAGLAGAWYGLAEIEESRRNFEAVGSLLQKVVELDSKHVDARLRLARLALLRGEFDKALQLANAADALRPESHDILTTKAAILLKLDDREGALSNAEKALRLNPNSAEALTVLAADKFNFGDVRGALESIDQGLSADPFNLGLLLFKMKIFEHGKETAKVEAIMRTIVDTHPDQKNFRRALASYYAGLGRKDEAEKEMRALTAASPGDRKVVLELAEFLRATRGVEAARTELLARIKSDDASNDYRLALARLEFADGKFATAMDILNAVISRGEQNSDVWRSKVLLAQMLLDRKDRIEAGRLIKEVLTADAKNVDALHLRAAIGLEEGRYGDAIADARQALNEQPKSVAILQLIAAAHERSGSVDLAEERLADAVKVSSLSAVPVLNYANFLLRRGSVERADDLLSRAVAQSPNDARLLEMLAQIRLRIADWTGAQSIGEVLRKLGDRSGAADQILGAASLGQNKFDESIRLFQSAYRATPTAVQPMYSLVMAYVRAGKAPQAEAFLESLLRANPNNADALVLLGSLQAARNEPDQAVAKFQAAITRQPSNPAGYSSMAKFRMSRKEYPEAETVIRAGLAEIPGQFGLRLTLAALFEQKKQLEAAISEYERLLVDYPDALVIVNNLASLLSDYRTDKASLERAQVLALRLKDGQAPHFRDTVGWISYLNGNYREALSNLEHAVKELGKHALVRYHLGMTYAALQQRDKAEEQLKKALELSPESDALRRKVQEALAKSGPARAL